VSDRLVRTIDPADRAEASGYDALGRAAAFAYDAVHNLLSASNAVAWEAFAYDVMNSVATADTTINGITFANAWKRDLGGLVTNILYAAGKTVTRTYDADGRLESVSDWLGHTWAFTHDGAAKLTSVLSPGGILSTNAYDLAGRLSGWSIGTVAGRVITRDEAGVKTKENVTAGLFPNPLSPRRAVNAFDAADRLVSATVIGETNTVAETYLHDLSGAVTNIVSGTGSVFTASYDPYGRLSSLSASSVPSVVNSSYDAIGNRVVTGDRIWVPDHADPLKRPLLEAGSNGEPVRYYIWGGGRLLGFISAADDSLTVAHCDEQGSVIALTDEQGAVLHQACYGPYGEDWGQSGANPTPFAWLGAYGVQKLPGNAYQLYITRYRLYSATLSRFLSADPIGLGGGPNLYAYCLGNPLAYIDPLGLCGDQTYGFGSGDYLDDVDQFLYGEGDAIVGALQGLVNFVMNPSQTTMDAMAAIAALDSTIRDFADSVSTAWNSGYRGQGQLVGGTLIAAATIAAPYATSVSTASVGANSSLYRAVGPAELADIQANNGFRNLGPAEGKYFTTSPEAAASYARQAVSGFGDPPYTLIQTSVPNSIFSGLQPAIVDRGIPTWVIPNDRLPGLVPQVLNTMPIPRP
jgi:RHS repeat-associated protein